MQLTRKNIMKISSAMLDMSSNLNGLVVVLMAIRLYVPVRVQYYTSPKVVSPAVTFSSNLNGIYNDTVIRAADIIFA